MRDRASETARAFSGQAGIIGVALSGSTARGPVGASSDLDLHVVVADDFAGSLPEWTFHGEGIIENLHTVREGELARGWRACGELASLAAWFYETRLGDELHQSVSLWWSPATQWRERLPELVALRQDPDVAQRVALRYAESARGHISRARSACREGAPLDGYHHLRLAFQAALIAAMIQRGWTIRGSKKRIEIAQAFLPDPAIERLLAIGLDIVGLSGTTSSEATALCEARLRYRATLLGELRELGVRHAHNGSIARKLGQVIGSQETHDAMAYDYYSPLVAQGIVLGPVNHIRCVSGLTRVPQMLVSCLYGEQPWSITGFVESGLLSRAVRDAWLEIMALPSSERHCARLSSALGSAVDGLDRYPSNEGTP